MFQIEALLVALREKATMVMMFQERKGKALCQFPRIFKRPNAVVLLQLPFEKT